jgi:IclR family KDG regulon transcriptional repressor
LNLAKSFVFEEDEMKKENTVSKPKETPYFLVMSTQKALGILEVLCKEGEKGVTELVKKVGLGKSNVHRLLATLSHLGYVEQDPTTSKYSPSLKTYELGNAVVNRTGLLPIVHPYLEELGEQFHETNNLAILDRGDVIYIDKVESPESLRMDIKIGSRVPAYCTALGKVLLAFLGEPEFRKFMKSQKLAHRTKKTVTSLAELKRNLQQVQTQGYAIDDEELYEGVRCIAAPIRGCNGKVIAAISIAGPSIRMNHDQLAQLKVPLLAAAKEICKKLGYSNREG